MISELVGWKKVACTHRFRVWKNGGMNPNFFGQVKSGKMMINHQDWVHYIQTNPHENTWNMLKLETTNRIDWVSFLQICQLAASKWLYQCWINAHDERPTINLDMFSGFGLITKLYDKLQYEPFFFVVTQSPKSLPLLQKVKRCVNREDITTIGALDSSPHHWKDGRGSTVNILVDVIFYLKETIVVPRKMTINSRVCNMSLHWSTYCLYYMIIYIYDYI